MVIFVGPYFTFFTHCDYRTLSSHVKKILFHSIYFMGLLIYHLGYQTEHIPTGFVSVAISGGFGENLANLTGLLGHTRQRSQPAQRNSARGWASVKFSHLPVYCPISLLVDAKSFPYCLQPPCYIISYVIMSNRYI